MGVSLPRREHIADNIEIMMLNAIEAKKIAEGDVIVLLFQGPAGAPGMPEMLTPTDAIMGAGYKRVALITDGRFSGGTTGPCIGHIEMEAYNGGTIGAIKDGDIIEIDIPNRKLNVKLSDDEIDKRLKRVKAPERTLTPLLVSYREEFTGVNCYGTQSYSLYTIKNHNVLYRMNFLHKFSVFRY